MTRFAYAYQRILDIREIEQDQAQAEVAEAIREQEQSVMAYEKIRQQLDDQIERYEQQRRDCMAIHELQLVESHIDHLRKHTHWQATQLKQCQKKLDRKQEKLRNRQVEAKKWSLLKAKQKASHDQLVKQLEENELNEFATQRYGRMLRRG